MLAQDRQLHISSLLDLGFEFDADPDLPEFATFIEASMSQCAFLFRDSIPSSSQIHFLQQMNEHQERAENQEKDGKDGKDQSKLIGKVPGVVLFFLRGLEMLQNICGMLEAWAPLRGARNLMHFHFKIYGKSATICKWFSYKLMDLLTMDEFGISYILYVLYI